MKGFDLSDLEAGRLVGMKELQKGWRRVAVQSDSAVDQLCGAAGERKGSGMLPTLLGGKLTPEWTGASSPTFRTREEMGCRGARQGSGEALSSVSKRSIKQF